MKLLTPLLITALLATLAASAQTPPISAPPLRQFDFPPGGCPSYGALPEPLRTQAASPAQVYPSQPAIGSRPAFPATMSIARAPCGLNVAEAELRLSFIPDGGAQLERPRINIVQRGIDYGCAGIAWAPKIIHLDYGAECEEFAWFEPVRTCTGLGFSCPTPVELARMPRTAVTATLSSRALKTGFDPDLPFTMRVRGNWPEDAPDLVYEVAGRGVNYDLTSLPADIVGMWWNPAEPGWALLVDRNWRGAVNAAWLTYDDAGNSTWFVMLNGQAIAQGVVEGEVYTTRGRPFSRFDSEFPVSLEGVGRFRLNFRSGQQGSLQFNVNGISGQRTMEKFEVRTKTGEICSHLRGWMQTGVDGWAATFDGNPTRADCFVHASMLVYDDAGRPFWVFGSLLPKLYRETLATAPLSGQLFRPTGTPYGQSWDASRFATNAPVGTWRSTQFIPNDPYSQVTVEMNGTIRTIKFERFRFEY